MTEKLGEQGIYVQPGNNRFEWDDGSDHENVTKIYVMGSNLTELIKIDYIKNGKRKEGSFHGTTETGYLRMFEIDHLNNEYLESVEVYYKPYSFIHGIQFKTNLRVSEIMGYTSGNKFTLASHGKKIIGFHGVGKDYSQALGAYVTPVTPKRMEAEGGKQGKEWDDGANHEAITKIHVRTSFHGIQYVSFDYVDMDGHQKEGPHHGSSSHGGFTLEPFEINHLEKEYLLSVDGYYDNRGMIKALQFKTNVKASELEYDEEGTKFTLGCKGMEIIGFHGVADEKLNSLGVYLKTLPLTKLEFKGGERGTIWDDGTFNGVRKVSVFYDSYYVRCITFEYDNGGKVLSRQHGSKLEYSGEEGEFVVDYPNEYLTSVEGTLDEMHVRSPSIESLCFKTSKGRTSPRFGNMFDRNRVEFVLESKGCALVGFHGQASTFALHSLGAYSFPMTPLHDAEKLNDQGGD